MKRMILNSNAKINIVRIFFTAMLIFTATTFLKADALSDPSEQQKKSEVITSARSSGDFDLLPDGTTFAFWNDQTTYTKVLHVAQNNPQASDDNPGTMEKPLKTINAAAQLLQSGEKVIVHEGIYRECIRPARGGTSPNKMIAYEVAKDENVIVKGSEIWKPQFRPSNGFGVRLGPRVPTTNIPITDDVKILMADIPEDFFKAYNPFTIRNIYRNISTLGLPGEPEWMYRAMLYRGAVYVDGKPLKQVLVLAELAQNENSFWVEDPGLRLHIRLSKDIDPSTASFEVTAREQIFAPRDFGLGYIKISGFTFEHAADGLPFPQRAAVSTMHGHHWIIENNRIEWANAEGIDLGGQDFPEDLGLKGVGHLVRNNIIRNCGICGISGAYTVEHTLIEGNIIEKIGSLNLERKWECMGIKFHFLKNSLIRNNILRNLTYAGGLWLDCSNTNNRITNNVFANISTITGAVYSEMNYDLNLVDHNIFWDIHCYEQLSDNSVKVVYAAIRADCNEKLVVVNNFFGKVENQAVSFSLNQSNRRLEGRTGICYSNVALNNIFYQCATRIYLARHLENKIDGNLYDQSDDNCSFILEYPAPINYQNLAGWQEYYELDKHSTQAKIEADFDIENCILKVKIDGKMPEFQALESLINGKFTGNYPGPFRAAVIQDNSRILTIEQEFPL